MVSGSYTSVAKLQRLFGDIPSVRPEKLFIFSLETLVSVSTTPFPLSERHPDFCVVSGEDYYFVRPRLGLCGFIENLSPFVTIGIWSSSTSSDLDHKISRVIFGMRPLFVFGRAEAVRTLVPGGRIVFLKLLSSVFAVNERFSFSNAVLVDSDATSLIKNPFFTYVCPPPLTEFCIEDSSFLVDVLLPYLSLLEDAWDVRCFIRNHHPRWSCKTINECTRFPTYKSLVRMCLLPSPSENVLPKYPLTLLSPHEISNEQYITIQKFRMEHALRNRPNVYTNVRELASRLHFRPDAFPRGRWPCPRYSADFIDLFDVDKCSPEELVDYDMSYFYLFFIIARHQFFPLQFQADLKYGFMPFSCNRDTSIDKHGLRGTCSTDWCGKCGRKSALKLCERPFG